eukprot:m.95389 g.95389  ORF g.95389 m.95389 type:complete len:316 (+) comp10103_c0_seq2:794-1741(+)
MPTSTHQRPLFGPALDILRKFREKRCCHAPCTCHVDGETTYTAVQHSTLRPPQPPSRHRSKQIMALRAFFQLVDATHTTYPLPVHVAHDLLSIASYRQWRLRGGAGWTDEHGAPSWLHCLLASYFYGNGGTAVTDTALGFGGPVTQLARHPTVSKYWLACFILIRHCPGDALYTWLTTRQHPVRLVCRGLDAVDDVSAMVGAMNHCRQAFPLNPLAPLVGGMLMNCGGGIFTYMDAKSRGLSVKHPFAVWSPSVRRAMCLCLVYWTAMRRGSAAKRWAHRYLTLFCVLSAWTEEFMGVSLLESFDAACMRPLLPP